MRMRLLFSIAIVPWVAAWGDRPLPRPYAGPMPDEPVATVSDRYAPVGAGLKSFQTVEPMPWGDVNTRVSPENKAMPAPTTPGEHDMKKMQ